MNLYQHRFAAECPNNGLTIDYSLTIISGATIMVEDIVEQCRVGPTFHEVLADMLYKRFGGRQLLCATHHGVFIGTIRG